MAMLDLARITAGNKPERGSGRASPGTDFRTLAGTIPDDEWDRRLARFADASLDQSAIYSQSRWGSNRDSHFTLIDHDRPAAMARLVTFAAPIIKRGLAFVKFGLVWRSLDATPDIAIYRRMIAALCAEYCERRGLLLTIQPRPSPVTQEDEESALHDQDFVQRRPMKSPERFFVDLRISAEEQRKSLSQK